MHWPGSLAYWWAPGSARGPVSKTNERSNQGRHLAGLYRQTHKHMHIYYIHAKSWSFKLNVMAHACQSGTKLCSEFKVSEWLNSKSNLLTPFFSRCIYVHGVHPCGGTCTHMYVETQGDIRSLPQLLFHLVLWGQSLSIKSKAPGTASLDSEFSGVGGKGSSVSV